MPPRVGCVALDGLIKDVHMSSRAGAGIARSPRPAMAPDGTEERILAAAERCLSRLGLSKLPLTDVATQAGLSRGAVYLHFADRRTLIDALLTRAANRFVASCAET